MAKTYNEEQKYKKTFKKVLHNYRIGEFEKTQTLLNELSKLEMDQDSQPKFQKILLLLLIGELYGLHTLNKILHSFGIKSNNYHKLWKKVSYGQIVRVLNDLLWVIFGKEFQKRCTQSDATRTRQKMTLVIDGSIFKQWLKDEPLGKLFDKYFSGQFKKAVYGFNLILCGMVIGEVFYPLHFHFRRKSEKDVKVAANILKKVHRKLRDLAAQVKVDLPHLHLSVDSGFRSKELVALCEGFDISYIGVPKSPHLVQVNEHKQKIRDLKATFEVAEAIYLEECLKEGIEPELFTMRIRGKYKCMGQEMVFLLFRLNGSKKVSIIFTSDLNMKSKTLRRHWFNRTKIEQFFRIMKHDLKIQQTTSHNFLGMLRKFVVCLVKALHVQLFTQWVRKRYKSLRHLGFAALRQLFIVYQTGMDYLEDILFSEPFATRKQVKLF